MPRSSKERNDSSKKSSSETSHNVHSVNYKYGEILKKEIQSLNREEKNTVCSLTIDQRIVATRFRNKLTRSVEMMKHHNRVRSRFHHKELLQDVKVTQRKGIAARQNRQKAAREEKEQADSDNVSPGVRGFSLKRFTDLGALKKRPQTAVEVQSKLWNKRAETAKQRVVRAKSAPPSSWRNCEDIVRKLDCGGGGFYAANKVNRPLSRAKLHEVFDSESYAKFRNLEVGKQEEEVQSFILSIKKLELVPWYPGPVPKRDEDLSVQNIDRSSSFVTRIDSFM